MAATNLSCESLIDRSISTFGSISNRMEKNDVYMLQLIGFGGFSLFLAIMYNLIRKYVFKDADNLDTTFDAGGKVSMSLTAVTVASQFLWPGDLLQSATMTIKGGISGPFWFTVGNVAVAFLYPTLSVQFKTKAPGAKTFLQIARARFGNKAHIIFIIFALMTNLVILSCLLVAGSATFQAMIKDASPEFCFIVMATLFGSYSFVGGLGTTFYVSYFNALLIVVILIYFIVNLFYVEHPEGNNILGNIDSIYQQLLCLEEKNGDGINTYLTFSSEDGIIWGVVGMAIAGVALFGDQTIWQSRIAAKPIEGVMGFFAGTLIWFAVPLTIGSSAGLSYLALSSSNSSFMLSVRDIDSGLALPFIMDNIMGYTGGVLVVIILSMALMSTGSGEIMGISSVIVYDIYQVYIRPFRKDHHPLECLLCGQTKYEDTGEVNQDREEFEGFCQCPRALECPKCKLDHKNNKYKRNLGNQKQFDCPFHGQYRKYQDSLIQFKNWCILWLTIALIPLGLSVDASGIDLNWMMMVGFTVITSVVPPLMLTLLWVKTSAEGVISGTISGLVIGFTVFLSVASSYEGGLRNFYVNMLEKYALLSGAGSCLLVSFVVTPVISIFTHKITDKDSALMEWKKLRDIDNPLHPWGELFREEFPELNGQRPDEELLNKTFRAAKLTAYIGGAILIIPIVIIMPTVMISLQVLDLNQFKFYLTSLQFLCFVVGGIVVVVAPVHEISIVLRKWLNNKPKISSEEGRNVSITLQESNLLIQKNELVS